MHSLGWTIPSETMDIDLNGLKALYEGIDTDTYTTVTATALMSYDYMLTFADEVRLVWPSRLSAVKILFFLNRLFAFSVLILSFFVLGGKVDRSSCKNLPRVVLFVHAAIFVVSQLFLLMRVHAIWNFDKKVLAIVALLFVPGFTGILYVAAVSTSDTTVVDIPGLLGTGCFVDVKTNRDWIIFMILLIQEASMLCLVLLRAFLVTRNRPGHTLSGMYRMIVEDNIGYFLCVSLLSLADLCIFLFPLGPQASGFVIIHSVLQSIICARLFLRLRVLHTRTWQQ